MRSAAPAADLESLRPRLFGVAYRMLGHVADAEDLVQELFLRWHQAPRGDVQRPAAWLRSSGASPSTACAATQRAGDLHRAMAAGTGGPAALRTPSRRGRRAGLLNGVRRLRSRSRSPVNRAAQRGFSVPLGSPAGKRSCRKKAARSARPLIPALR
jgi:RNA polymerase sigma-70 factor, ECF subfamily